MILIADGGSTKVEWRLTENGKTVRQIFTKGANPYFRTQEDISHELTASLCPEIKGYVIHTVHFYGAGCSGPEKNEIIRRAIADCVEASRIEVDTDMLGAARGLCGHERGIVCIIGTGSNSCLYDGEKITANVSPLGYILGDEGSGAVIGRLFVGALLKNRLTPGLKEKFLQKYALTPAGITENVYRRPMANRFLAGFAPFVKENIADPSVEKIVNDTFREFFVRNVMQYDCSSHAIYMTGSVAWHFRNLLRKTALDLGLEVTRVEPSPMDGLVAFHA
jgi:N-acetylglucosamine kinase-like BadF-type ATPase